MAADAAAGPAPAPAGTPFQTAPGVPQFALLATVALGVGLLAGAGASGFIWAEHHLQHWLWHTLPERLGHHQAPLWLALLILLTGSVLTYLAAKLPGNGGHSPLAGFAMDITPDKVVSAILAAIASLSFGAVLGPEAPLLAVGTALGALAVRSRPGPVTQIMMLAGAMAAVGAIFGNPLVSVILLLEMAIIAGPPLTAQPVLLSALAALASGYVLQVGFAPWTGLGEAQLAVPSLPAYPEVHLADVAVGIPLAVLIAIIGMSARMLGAEVASLAAKRPLAVLAGSGAAIAVLAWGGATLADANIDMVLFSGQSSIPDYLALTSVGSAAILLVAKFCAYALSLGAGFRGGSIFPAIALGVLLVSVASQQSEEHLNASALTAAAISAATAATMRLPFIATVLGVMLTYPAGGATTVLAIIGTIVGLLTRLAAEERFPGLAPPPRGSSAAR